MSDDTTQSDRSDNRPRMKSGVAAAGAMIQRIGSHWDLGDGLHATPLPSHGEVRQNLWLVETADGKPLDVVDISGSDGAYQLYLLLHRHRRRIESVDELDLSELLNALDTNDESDDDDEPAPGIGGMFG